MNRAVRGKLTRHWRRIIFNSLVVESVRTSVEFLLAGCKSNGNHPMDTHRYDVLRFWDMASILYQCPFQPPVINLCVLLTQSAPYRVLRTLADQVVLMVFT